MNTMQNKQDSNKSEYNIMITNVSLVNTNNLTDTNEYIFDELDEGNKKIKGNMTNEAPIEGLQKLLEKNEKQLDKIIMIVSESVRNKTINENSRNKTEDPDGNLTSLEFLCRKIEKYENTNIEKVEIKDEPEEKDTVETINKVKNMIEKVSEDNPEMQINIYIESNGGVRYVIFMLYNIISIMSKNNHNIILKGIYSMVYSNKPTRIKNTQNIYESSELIAIVGEYINYGRIESLKKYVDKRLNQEEDDNLKKDINRCMNKLEEFSQALQLCRSEWILRLLSANNEESVLTYLKKFNQKYNKENSTNAIIFGIVFSMIWQEFKGFNKNSDDNNLDNIIEWCLKKDYVQQALTLCSEQIPKYLIDNKIIEFDDEFNRKFWADYKKDGRKYEENYYKFITYIPKYTYEEYLIDVKKNFTNISTSKIQISENEKVEINNEINYINAAFLNSYKNGCEELKNSFEKCKLKSGTSILEFSPVTYGKKYDSKVKELICINSINLKKLKDAIIKGLRNQEDKELVKKIFFDVENKMKEEIKKELKELVLVNGGKITNMTGIKFNDTIYCWGELFKIKNLDMNMAKSAIICRICELSILRFDSQLMNEIYECINYKKINIQQFTKYINKTIYKYKRNICCADNIHYKINVSLKTLEKTIMIYGIAKEQRNTVNHAHSADGTVVLDIYALKNLMYALVDSMREVKKRANNSVKIQ